MLWVVMGVGLVFVGCYGGGLVFVGCYGGEISFCGLLWGWS